MSEGMDRCEHCGRLTWDGYGPHRHVGGEEADRACASRPRVLVSTEESTSPCVGTTVADAEHDELARAGWVLAVNGRDYVDPDNGDTVTRGEAIRLLRRHGVRGDVAWQRAEGERIGSLVLDREVGDE